MRRSWLEEMAAIFPGADQQVLGMIHRGAGFCQSRRAFTTAPAPAARLVLMGPIRRVTVHHTGFPEAFWKSSRRETATHLEEIRRFHTTPAPQGRGWADIGYHFAIDRVGRIWQLRPLQFQGAHVKNHNDHNVGVVVLGNFDIQKPPPRQLDGLVKFLTGFCRIYHLPPRAIFTHRELADQPTSCPGHTLQQWLNVNVRRRNA